MCMSIVVSDKTALLDGHHTLLVGLKSSSNYRADKNDVLCCLSKNVHLQIYFECKLVRKEWSDIIGRYGNFFNLKCIGFETNLLHSTN